MVFKIDPPKENSVKIFEKILGGRKHYLDFYNKIQTDWKVNINLYIKHEGDPSYVKGLNLLNYTSTAAEAKARKKSLINLYKPKKGELLHGVLHKMRRKHGLINCPSCGEAGTPETLDHYLPKDEFPEFSILLLNLVPMCSRCQEAKGTKFETDKGLKKFIHPYFDQINTPLYKVIFSTPYSHPKFSIQVNPRIDPSLKSLVFEHIEGLNLHIRFKRFCNTKYIHLLKIAKKHRLSNTQNKIRAGLEFTLGNEEEKAINCWEAIFYRSVLEDENLLIFLENSKLPDKL